MTISYTVTDTLTTYATTEVEADSPDHGRQLVREAEWHNSGLELHWSYETDFDSGSGPSGDDFEIKETYE